MFLRVPHTPHLRNLYFWVIALDVPREDHHGCEVPCSCWDSLYVDCMWEREFVLVWGSVCVCFWDRILVHQRDKSCVWQIFFFLFCSTWEISHIWLKTKIYSPSLVCFVFLSKHLDIISHIWIMHFTIFVWSMSGHKCRSHFMLKKMFPDLSVRVNLHTVV